MNSFSKFIFSFFLCTIFVTPNVYSGGCKSWDSNCDPKTGGRTYDANRDFKQKQKSLRTGQGSWDRNTDKWGDKKYDMNKRNGCKAYDLNCK